MGVPQNAVTSPTLFNVNLNDLLVKQDQLNLTVLAFANDLMFIARDEIELIVGLNKIVNWTAIKISLNKGKSAIIIIRKDERTKLLS